MKKIIASGFVLTTLLSTTPQISTLIVSTIKVNNINNLQKWTPTSEDFEYIEKYFNSKTEQEKQELKENLLSAIGLKNDVVVFDKTKLNEKIWDLKIYQIITSNEYLQTLKWFYKIKFLSFDKQGKPHFDVIKNINLNPWFETYWYWFGYWRLHFNSNDIDSIVEGGTTVTEIAEQIIEAAPYLGPIALAIAVWITANVAGLKAYDQGRGAWVAYFQLIPIPIGFGSN